MSDLRIIEANLADPAHRQAVLELTCAYARDAMGCGKDLPQEVQQTLVERLAAHPTTLIFLAEADGRAIGIATCFLGFSTFAAKPLINIHDLHVLPEFQRHGIGRRLLAAVEAAARARDCCKLTLEVQDDNHRAANLYRSFGFAASYQHSDAQSVVFLQKRLGDYPQ